MRHSTRSTILACAAVTALLAAQPVSATLIAHFVDATYNPGVSTPLGQFDSASISVLINPSLTNWIAWNNAPTVLPGGSSSTVPACSVGEAYAGMCLGGALDDYVRITVTNPGGASLAVNYDQNDGFNNPFGQQNVIFGTADAAPDARRNNFSAVYTLFDEAGAQNALFTATGMYTFTFSWQNVFFGGASHPDTYVLVDSNPLPPGAGVPEPMTLSLLGTGLACIGALRRRASTPENR